MSPFDRSSGKRCLLFFISVVLRSKHKEASII